MLAAALGLRPSQPAKHACCPYLSVHIASCCFAASLQEAHLLRRVAGSLQSVCQGRGVAEGGAPLRVHVEAGGPVSSLPLYCFLLPAFCCQLLTATEPQLPQLDDLHTKTQMDQITEREAKLF